MKNSKEERKVSFNSTDCVYPQEMQGVEELDTGLCRELSTATLMGFYLSQAESTCLRD